MLAPFFAAAMTAPGRHLSFRRVAAAHVLLVAAVGWTAARTPNSPTLTTAGYLLLVLGLVEGAALVGWRLTQLPKSQALEFLLVSPVQPRRLFVAEALVGVCRFALVQLAGLPVLGLLAVAGAVEWADLLVLGGMPFAWGVVAGLGLTAWVYETAAVRRAGEWVGLLGVLVYLVVGVVAGENLRLWLEQLPESVGRFLFDAVMLLHTMNPFGVVRGWFAADRAEGLAFDRLRDLHLVAAVLVVGFGLRAAFRLRGHFHDRHYRPVDSSRAAQLERIGDRPLSWWAVRRVMEYSGRVNLWLAGGFSLVYAAYLVAGDDWPAWMGRLVFQLFEGWGGAPVVAAALCVLAAVPAAYQYGVWDPTVADRCRRLELLLLTELSGKDYWHASLSAAWKRGRGYLVGAGFLWLALGVAGRATWAEVTGAAAGGAVLWAFSFAAGFRAFATGNQSSGLASLLTLGAPLAVYGLLRLGWEPAAAFVPPAACYLPLASGLTGHWAAGLAVAAWAAAWLAWQGRRRCEGDLRRWYDANQGARAVS